MAFVCSETVFILSVVYGEAAEDGTLLLYEAVERDSDAECFLLAHILIVHSKLCIIYINANNCKKSNSMNAKFALL